MRRGFPLRGISLALGFTGAVVACGDAFVAIEDGAGGGGAASSTSVGNASGGGNPTSTGVATTNGSGASTTGSGGAMPACPSNGTTFFQSDFDSEPFGLVWETEDAVRVGQQDGYGHITLIGQEDLWATSKEAFTLRDCQLSLEVIHAAGCLDCESTLAIIDATGADKGVAFAAVPGDGALFADEYDGQNFNTLAQMTLPDGRHYWRFRESNGQLQWAVSPNGQTWTPLHTGPTPPWAANVRVELRAYGFAEAAQDFRFDNLNQLR